ncbi:uncharacterized protein [Primulina huaijiensis]|uniref:uncharacterized protein isoform X2 n=1 Tax=Primulina huaijiensis TaxID=1492673 RepID=UPI003CC6F7F0
MGRGHTEFSPLLPPTPITKHSEIDLESGTEDQIQCRICLETDGRDFIAPCKCKGTSKYVHRACLNHWRAVKEGFAFAHCTTCKAPYYLKADNIRDRRWRTIKFRFFVTRDITFIFLAIQMVIAILAYLVYLIDGSQKFWLRLTWGFGSELSFYYVCGTVLFFAFIGLSGCFITCFDQRIRNDPAVPCRELHRCCCELGVLVATMVGQRIWQRHYHILAKRMLTEEYVVENVDDEMNEASWSPPPLAPDDVQQLKALGLL